MVIEIIHGIQENILQTRWLTDYEHKVYYTVLKKSPTWYILIRHNGTSYRTYLLWIKDKRGQHNR